MIKFVYFDIGGVVVKDFSGNDKWGNFKKLIGVEQEFDKKFDKLYDKYEDEDLNLTREVDSLIPILSEKFKIQFPPDFSLLTYYVDYFQPSTSLWPVITEIKRTSKVGLLTNMYVGMLDLIRDRNLLPSIDWDVVIDSSKVDLQKPDPKIYLLAQKLSGVENGEILFVDNSKKNIDAAKNLGWTIFYFGSSDYEKSSSNLLEFYRNLPL
ncbi:MAG: Protein containing Haloacid dehalogenase-like protein hydrolase domain protein [Candidatus Woesebacteria bacterium GW2011_GWA1_39_21]|uniref:Protein containing Haloacid dehalogenase-like protein hydrolase domain protein n=1 Tax=Candidatus Woesebacteria bacterium GW2011_GWA1_39_21 TaxID=1618550 RepID=A0A0G0QJC9_9BACT|nr:MAG: Protein containing Haloacid dehalogenase-like protein hydrolase domain protein [Candidatus Woesebacteria bacterium GW2011_GWA1_39_21]